MDKWTKKTILKWRWTHGQQMHEEMLNIPENQNNIEISPHSSRNG
jgi:hypothetical protein